MEERPLRIPILLGGSCNDLPPGPTHIASWTSPGESSTSLALAYPDNSICLTTLPSSAASTSSNNGPGKTLPSVPAPPTIASPTPPSGPSIASSSKRPPPASRSASYAGRSRAPSSASSILSTSSRARRVPALSPPTSPIPTTSLSSAFALGIHENLSQDGGLGDAPLREHLREQSRASADDERGSLGLGAIAGLGRRGVSGVKGKEERSDSGNGTSGLASPNSITSDESSRTLGSRLKGWIGAGSGTLEDKRDVNEMIVEVEVEREMERELQEDAKEKEDQEAVERARRTPLSTPGEDRSPVLDPSGPGQGDNKVVRVILKDAGRGRIIDLKALEGWGVCILRDIGTLDIISTRSFECVASINLEEPEDKSSVASSSKTPLRLTPFWTWQSIHLVSSSSSPGSALVVQGLPWPCHTPSPNGEVTRIIVVSHPGATASWASSGGAEIVARLDLPGEGSVGVVTSNNENYLVHFTSSSVTSYSLTFTAARPVTPAAPARSSTPLPRAVSTALANLPLRSSTPSTEMGLRGVKSMMTLKEDGDGEMKNSLKKLLGGKSRIAKEEAPQDAWALGEGKEVTRDGYGEWRHVVLHPNGEGAGWSGSAVDLFECDGKSLRVRGSISLDGNPEIKSARFSPGWKDVVILSENNLNVYQQQLVANKTNQKAVQFSKLGSLKGCSAVDVLSSGETISAADSGLSVLKARNGKLSSRTISKFTRPSLQDLSIVVPLDIETCFASDDRGNISKRKLAEILSGKTPCADSNPSADRLDSPVSCLRGFTWRGTAFLAAGDHDGVVRIWNASTFELQGSFTLFAWPVQAIALMDIPEAGSLRGCLLCTSEAGTVGLISLTDMEQLFLMPAARTPLRRIFIGSEDVMLAYANGKARVWNVESMEFRRSTGLDAAEDMLSSGDWAEVDLEVANASKDDVLSSVFGVLPASTDTGRLLQLDLRKLGKWLHEARNNSDRSPLGVIRVILSMLLTFGVDAEVDRICQKHLGISKPTLDTSSGIESHEGGGLSICGSGNAAWHTSSCLTAIRQLGIVTLLRPFLDSPDDERWAAQIIAYYTAALPSTMVEPDMEFFARYYLDSASDVHQAARMLFAARLDRMSEEEIEAVVSKHQADLPSLRSASTAQDEASTLALTMIGGMALQKFQCINPTALKAVSESLSLYLHSADPLHLALGIELTSKGFSTWQTYIDPSDLLRRLFYLSTHPGPSRSNIAAQARLAVLHVANHHAALFMSTLSMDILDAKTVEGRTSIMKLCVYLARKKPQVLEHSLPKIAEAVVKSLDPNLGKMREDVWQAATVILNELVLAFSTIDFHSGTQKLAIGTHEGSLIMFDLKTASRLYILQPHQKPVSAVMFSPDGRRLITVSLQEGCVTVWKIGSSISGFFNVGGPPRQGSEKGEPFKRIDFRRADDKPMDSTSALSDIKIEWPGARQARVTIKETMLTFET